MPVRLAAQQLGGTLADPLGTFAPQEPPVVEEEPQQLQVGISDMSA